MGRLTPRRLLNVALIAVFVVLVLPLYVSKGMSDSLDHVRGTGTVGGIDFKAYYIAADMLRAGEDFYDVELQTNEVLARGLPLNESFYIYPPLLAISFVPLTALSMENAARLWFFLNLILYGLSLIVISRALELRRVTRLLPFLWTLSFLFPPALFTLYKGQVNILILLLLAMTYWLYRRRSQPLAGLALGLATMIKLIPVCLLPYFLWKREYVLSLVAVGSIVFISILSIAIAGSGPCHTYVTSVLPSLTEPRPNPSNQSLGGFLSLLLIDNAYSDNLAHSPTTWKALTIVLSALVILAVVFLFWHNRQRDTGLDLEFALVVASMPLIANISWVDFFVVLVIPYAISYRYLAQRGMRNRSVVPLLASALLVSFPRFLDVLTNLVGGHVSFLRNPLTMGFPLYGLIMLWATLAVSLWRAASREGREDG